MDAMQKFLEYASAYDDGSDTRIKLKIIHTQRVTEVMEQLTAARLLSEQDKKLAYLCAVYHDIGRFEQLKRYHTFLDYKSIDHAQLGCEILRQGDFLDELSAREREQVLTAIGNHNRLTIEDGLDERRCFCEVNPGCGQMRYFPGVCPGESCRYHRFFRRAGGPGSSFRCGI